MSLRGLVLGNSHAACLREACRSADGLPFSLDFVAAHRDKLDGLEFVDGHGVALTDDLRETLNKLGMAERFGLADFDFFVVTACQVAVFRAVEAANRMAVWPEPAGARILVSTSCFRAALADAMRQSTAFRLVTGLAEASVPILVLPQPHPHEAVLHPESRFAGFRRIGEAGRGAWLAEQFRGACDLAFAGMARVLAQPDRTVVRHLCTATRYSEGSVMLAARRHEHASDDILHANIDYGALQLDQVSAALHLRGADDQPANQTTVAATAQGSDL